MNLFPVILCAAAWVHTKEKQLALTSLSGCLCAVIEGFSASGQHTHVDGNSTDLREDRSRPRGLGSH